MFKYMYPIVIDFVGCFLKYFYLKNNLNSPYESYIFFIKERMYNIIQVKLFQTT